MFPPVRHPAVFLTARIFVGLAVSHYWRSVILKTEEECWRKEVLDRKEPKPLSHLHLLSYSALLPNIYKLTSFMANLALLVKNVFFLKTESDI